MTVWVRNATTTADAADAQGTIPFAIAAPPVSLPTVVTGTASAISTNGSDAERDGQPEGDGSDRVL